MCEVIINKVELFLNQGKGLFNNYVEKIRGERGQKMSVFVHAQGIKTVHAGGWGVKKWQNSVHVVVECPLTNNTCQKLKTFRQLTHIW